MRLNKKAYVGRMWRVTSTSREGKVACVGAHDVHRIACAGPIVRLGHGKLSGVDVEPYDMDAVQLVVEGRKGSAKATTRIQNCLAIGNLRAVCDLCVKPNHCLFEVVRRSRCVRGAGPKAPMKKRFEQRLGSRRVLAAFERTVKIRKVDRRACVPPLSAPEEVGKRGRKKDRRHVAVEAEKRHVQA